MQRVLALADKANGAVFARLGGAEAPAGPPPELAYGAAVADSGADDAWARYQRGAAPAGRSEGSVRGSQAQEGPSPGSSTDCAGPGAPGGGVYQASAVQERAVGGRDGAQSGSIRERMPGDRLSGASGTSSHGASADLGCNSGRPPG